LRASDNEVLVDGRVNLEDINDLFRLSLQGEGFDTVGGLLSASLGKIPSVGDVVVLGNLSFQVVSVHGRRVRQVRIVEDTEAAAT
jgi:CBS domain containing-hemolysin-like protein